MTGKITECCFSQTLSIYDDAVVPTLLQEDSTSYDACSFNSNLQWHYVFFPIVVCPTVIFPNCH